MIEPARHNLAVGPAEHFADRVYDSLEHVFGALLDPSRLGMLERLFAPRLGERPEVRVVKHRFNGRGSFVDSEQKLFSHSY